LKKTKPLILSTKTTSFFIYLGVGNLLFN